MTISSTAWEKYIQLLRKVNDKAAELIRTYLEANQIPQTQKEMNALIEYAYAVSTKYGEAAAAAAAGMYDGVAAASGMTLAPAVPAPTPEMSEVAKAVNGTLGFMLAEITASAIGRLVKRTGQDTTLQNAIRDKAYYAWIPMGDTCPFCISIAAEGWKRATAKALAGGHAEHIHGNCNCSYAIKHNEETEYNAYDPSKYEKLYDNAEGATEEGIGAVKKTLPNSMVDAPRRYALYETIGV